MEIQGQRKRKLNDKLFENFKLTKTIKSKNDKLNNLYTIGYQLLENHINIPPKVRAHLINLLNHKSSAIFNHNEKSRNNDMKRRQKNINPRSKYMIKFIKDINKILLSFFPNLYAKDWVVIKSLPGCKAQAAHIDYPPPNGPIHIKQVPINVIVALEPNTLLNVWPKSHELICREYKFIQDSNDSIDPDPSMYPIHMTTLKMKPGDILLFRGDLVHAGSKYDVVNNRMHCFLDYEYRIPNRTWLIHGNGSELLKKMILIE